MHSNVGKITDIKVNFLRSRDSHGRRDKLIKMVLAQVCNVKGKPRWKKEMANDYTE